jgi:hypothetical protein
MSIEKEIFVSVDVEASGPIPGKYSMLSIGACVAFDPSFTSHAISSRYLMNLFLKQWR